MADTLPLRGRVGAQLRGGVSGRRFVRGHPTRAFRATSPSRGGWGRRPAVWCTPLWPAGHLPLKGGDRMLPRLRVSPVVLNHHPCPIARHRQLALRALLLGGTVVEFAVTLGEVGCGDEAAGDGDFDDGHGGLDEQVAGAVEADFEVVAGGRAAHLLPEQALDLAAREAGIVGDFEERQRLGEIGFHQLDDLQHLGILHAEAGPERQALAVVGGADAVCQVLFADAVDEALAGAGGRWRSGRGRSGAVRRRG